MQNFSKTSCKWEEATYFFHVFLLNSFFFVSPLITFHFFPSMMVHRPTKGPLLDSSTHTHIVEFCPCVCAEPQNERNNCQEKNYWLLFSQVLHRQNQTSSAFKIKSFSVPARRLVGCLLIETDSQFVLIKSHKKTVAVSTLCKPWNTLLWLVHSLRRSFVSVWALSSSAKHFEHFSKWRFYFFFPRKETIEAPEKISWTKKLFLPCSCFRQKSPWCECNEGRAGPLLDASPPSAPLHWEVNIHNLALVSRHLVEMFCFCITVIELKTGWTFTVSLHWGSCETCWCFKAELCLPNAETMSTNSVWKSLKAPARLPSSFQLRPECCFTVAQHLHIVESRHGRHELKRCRL